MHSNAGRTLHRRAHEPRICRHDATDQDRRKHPPAGAGRARRSPSEAQFPYREGYSTPCRKRPNPVICAQDDRSAGPKSARIRASLGITASPDGRRMAYVRSPRTGPAGPGPGAWDWPHRTRALGRSARCAGSVPARADPLLLAIKLACLGPARWAVSLRRREAGRVVSSFTSARARRTRWRSAGI